MTNKEAYFQFDTTIPIKQIELTHVKGGGLEQIDEVDEENQQKTEGMKQVRKSSDTTGTAARSLNNSVN